MKKKIISSFLTCLINLIILSAFAVPANPDPVEILLPDGTSVTYYIKGDERVHWLQSVDGYTLLFNKDKFLEYATLDVEGNLVHSGHIYRQNQLRSSGEVNFLSKTPKDLRYSKTQIQTLSQIWEMTESSIARRPVLGEKKALCVLVGFPDKPFVKTVEEFENLMNQVGYSQGSARGSVKDFYRENSYGKMDLTVTVVGPYEAPNICSYYANDNRYQEFARMVAETADADVDFNDFANESGELETFHIIFAGYGDESSGFAGGTGTQIWSHKWELRRPIFLDGVRISVYSCSPELRGRNGETITSVGVICHELCHVFGAADYYDTDYAGSGGEYPGTGNWDLMANGSWNNNGDSPAHINMFQKILYGWVDPIELTSSVTISDMPNSTENPVAYVIRPTSNNEMYVLENRQRIGFDTNVPGSGLLIYHIHNSASTGMVNNTRHPQQAYVVASSITSASYAIPNSSRNSYGSINSSRTPFTNAVGRNEFSGTSIPQMFYWNGTSGVSVMDKPITDITQYEGLISFKYRGGNFEEPSPATNLMMLQIHDDGVVSLAWDAPDDGFPYYEYDLYRDGELIQSKITGTRFDDSLIVPGVYDYCVISSVFGQESESVCESFTYIVIEQLEQPQEEGICSGEEFVLVIDAEPENLFYQWYREDEIIDGANENEYRIPSFSEFDEGSYYVIVSDESGLSQKQSNTVELKLQSSSLCDNVKVNEILLTEVYLYPNPFSDNVYISSNESDIISIIITDLNGREIYVNKDIISQNINTSSWVKGVYIVKVTTRTSSLIYKIIKN